MNKKYKIALCCIIAAFSNHASARIYNLLTTIEQDRAFTSTGTFAQRVHIPNDGETQPVTVTLEFYNQSTSVSSGNLYAFENEYTGSIEDLATSSFTAMTTANDGKWNFNAGALSTGQFYYFYSDTELTVSGNESLLEQDGDENYAYTVTETGFHFKRTNHGGAYAALFTEAPDVAAPPSDSSTSYDSGSMTLSYNSPTEGTGSIVYSQVDVDQMFWYGVRNGPQMFEYSNGQYDGKIGKIDYILEVSAVPEVSHFGLLLAISATARIGTRRKK